MADGHLNKCIECSKNDVRAHRAVNLEKVRAYDRARASTQKRSEKNALDANIGKLADFIVLSAAYKHLGSAEKGRLHRQHTHMLAYSGVLLERIEAFTA